MNEVGIMMVKKQIYEDIEGEGVIQQRIGLKSQVLGAQYSLQLLDSSVAPVYLYLRMTSGVSEVFGESAIPVVFQQIQ